MFNIISRAQALSNHAITCTSVIAALVFISSFIQLYTNGVWSLNSSSISNVQAQALLKSSYQYGAKNGKPKENSMIKFDLDADLTSLFNWNTKQVFVYLTAEYPGKSDGSSNKVTYWDKIIKSPEDAKIKLVNQRAKYSVWDVENSFRQREANLTLEWNIQPHVGALLYGKTGVETPFTFAETKKKTN